MSNKELDTIDHREIIEFANIIAERPCDSKDCAPCIRMGRRCNDYLKAERAIKAGYRKQSENVVELPCKVGDTLYYVIDPENISHGQVLEVKVKSIEIEDTIRFFVKTVKHYLHDYRYVNIADFGKTVFFTQKEAEQVLAKMKGGAE